MWQAADELLVLQMVPPECPFHHGRGRMEPENEDDNELNEVEDGKGLEIHVYLKWSRLGNCCSQYI